MSVAVLDHVSQDRSTSLLVTLILTRSLSWIAVLLRFIARKKGGTRLWWDDWIILGDGILLIPAIAIESQLLRYHMGRHFVWVLQNDPGAIKGFSLWLYIGVLFYSPVVGLPKLSVLCLYHRLFAPNAKFRIACYVQLVLIACWIVTAEFLFAFRCHPVHLGWAATPQEGTCMPFNDVFVGLNAFDVFFNFTVLATPLVPLWNLQLPLKKKILVYAVLFVGCGDAVLSIIRLTKVAALTFSDVTWDGGTADLWSFVQCNLSCICACIPVLAPLLPRSWLSKSETSPDHTQDKRQSDFKLTRSDRRDEEDDNDLIPRHSALIIYRTDEFEVQSEAGPPKYSSEQLGAKFT